MLFDARFESSVTPPMRVTSDDILPGAQTGTGAGTATPSGGFSPGSFLRKLFLGLIRPTVYVKSDFGSRTWKPYGEPFPWQIGLVLMLLGIAYIGHLLFLAIRKAV